MKKRLDIINSKIKSAGIFKFASRLATLAGPSLSRMYAGLNAPSARLATLAGPSLKKSTGLFYNAPSPIALCSTSLLMHFFVPKARMSDTTSYDH